MKFDTVEVIGDARQVTTADPVSTNSFATKGYVDAVSSAAVNADLAKESARVASTENLTLSGTQTIDGVSVGVDDRVLVKNQTNAAHNGIYIAKGQAWERAPDADNSPGSEVLNGMFIFVREGTVNGQTAWILSTPNPITLNTTDLSFVQFTGGVSLSFGNGLIQVANTVGLTETGIAAGNYNSVDVDIHGRVTFGSKDVILAHDPVVALEAATKQYADAGRIYDISGFTAGAMLASQTILRFVSVRSITLPQNLTGSVASCGTAPTVGVSLPILKDGYSIGSINFAAGQTTGTFTFGSAVTLTSGSVVVVNAPSSADATFADLQFTLMGSF